METATFYISLVGLVTTIAIGVWWIPFLLKKRDSEINDKVERHEEILRNSRK